MQTADINCKLWNLVKSTPPVFPSLWTEEGVHTEEDGDVRKEESFS